MSETHHKINYVEWCADGLPATKAFYTKAFGWAFQDWGDDYADSQSSGIACGFHTQSPKKPPLVVLHSDDLEASLETVKAAGGVITVEIFSFPGGRRFHFTDPSGNELAIWGA